MTLSDRPSLWLGVALVAVTVGVTSGCAAFFPESSEPPTKGLRLDVENHQWSGATVYFVRDGVRFRLGFVEAQSTKSFRVSAARLGGAHEFRLIAEAIGSDRRVVTRPIQVLSGSTTVWSLEESSSLSTVVAR